ncbi:MAG TPA: pyrimidine dimer DNA glycosylase/endonuclease V [Rhodocyclaceae bacterium]|nr:pyrimidine dimer DNA glycosylase/endonuclease V [Rhodocyclaceae bacterium]
MRIWTLHPKYLDPKGLVALWREALLAQAVLLGQTRGYLHHPQLNRFRNAPSPVGAIAAYLRGVHAESVERGYRFDGTKIAPAEPVEIIEATRRQLDYEWSHLKDKLRLRAPTLLADMEAIAHPDAHPLFHIVPGGVADWEVTSTSRMPSAPKRRAGW